MSHIELKEHFLRSQENASGKDLIFRDTKQIGLGVKITPKGTKTFFAEGWVNGRSRRKKIGRYPEVTIEQARKDAKGFMGDFSRGIDRVAQNNARKKAEITVSEVLDDYIADRKKLKPGTIKDYKRVLNEGLKDWKTKPINAISKTDITERHRLLSENSPARADNTMRVLRALFNYAMEEYEIEPGKPLITQNPTRTLTAKKSWNKVERKTRYIREEQFEAWFDAVLNLQPLKNSPIHEAVRDYFLFLILSGFRETEAKLLEWKNVDLAKKTFKALDTKNRSDHELPMSDYLSGIFERRFMEKTDSPFVFPNKDDGPLKDMRVWYNHVSAVSGVEFTLHDLRRTFATVAESLDISHYALKRLVNHKTDRSDVTDGYLQIGAERLRKPMQAITDRLLELAKVTKP